MDHRAIPKRAEVRSPRISRLIAFVAVAVAAIQASSRADVLYGVTDGSPQLRMIDPTTGASTVIGPGDPSFSGPEALVVDAQGRLISVGFFNGLNNLAHFKTTFVSYDRQTGVATPVATDTTTYAFFEGLANVNGVIYASASAADSYGFDLSNHLVRVDLNAGTFTEVGLFGAAFQNVEELAYSPTYGLIGVDIGTLDPATNYQTFHTTPALIRIDPNTGVATKIADLPPSMIDLVGNPFNSTLSPYGPFITGLAFAADGTLFGTTFPTHFGGESRLVKIDPVTGAITDIGSNGTNNVDGIAFDVTPVPEPSTLALTGLGLGLTPLAARRARSRG